MQEVIVQNFRAKPGTRMASHPEPSLDDHLWTIAVARILLGPDWHVQAPPNLAYDDFPRLLDAGIDDWGGVSPVTIDHVNPEAPWPEVELLAEATRSRGLELAPRLPVYPEHVADLDRWVDPAVAPVRPPCGRRRSGSRATTRGRPASPARVPFVVGRDALPLELVGRRARRGRARRACSPPAATRRQRVSRRGRRAPPRGLRRRGHLRRHAERPVHERLLLPLRLLRVLEGQARARTCAARRTSSRSRRSSGAPRRRGSAARPRSASRAGSTRPSPATTTPTSSARSRTPFRGSTCTPSPRSRCGRERRRSRSRSTTTSRDSGTSGSARCRARRPRCSTTRCGGDLPGQGDDRAVARRARRGASRRPALERDDHVRPRRHAAELGAAPPARARAAATDGRVHRVRPAPVRPDGGADVPPGPRAPRPDLPRGAARPRGRAARAASRGSRTCRRRG